MDEGDRNRAFPDGGGHAFDIAFPDIADREHGGLPGGVSATHDDHFIAPAQLGL
jgi:hypothetical protein